MEKKHVLIGTAVILGTALAYGGYKYAIRPNRYEARFVQLEERAARLEQNLKSTNLRFEEQVIRQAGKDNAFNTNVNVLFHETKKLSGSDDLFKNQQQQTAIRIGTVERIVAEYIQTNNNRFALMEQQVTTTSENIAHTADNLHHVQENINGRINALQNELVSLQHLAKKQSKTETGDITSLSYAVHDGNIAYLSFFVRGAALGLLERIKDHATAASGNMTKEQKTYIKATGYGTALRTEIIFRREEKRVHVRNLLLIDAYDDGSASVFVKMQGNAELAVFRMVQQEKALAPAIQRKYHDLSDLAGDKHE